MSNFDKEYIKLCKDKKVQELRPKYRHGDWVIGDDYDLPLIFLSDGIVQITSPRVEFNKTKTYWLPDSGQLDEEIIKICKERKCHYVLIHDEECEAVVEALSVSDNIVDKIPTIVHCNKNPLIAKIKLLLELLRENK